MLRKGWEKLLHALGGSLSLFLPGQFEVNGIEAGSNYTRWVYPVR